MDILFFLIIIALVIFVIIVIGLAPIKIAKTRGITDSELATISILTWVGFVVGFTWFIALILALVYQPNEWIDKNKGGSNIDFDGLEKLVRLKKEGILTETEYKREKKKLMGK